VKNLVCLGKKKELEGTIKKMAVKKWVHKSKKIEEVGRQKREGERKKCKLKLHWSSNDDIFSNTKKISTR
jgi:hypothetical protein